MHTLPKDTALHKYDHTVVAASKKGSIVVPKQMIGEIGDAFKRYGERLTEILYNASVFSIILYTAALLMLLILGWAITDRIIHVPVFHPDIPVTSGS